MRLVLSLLALCALAAVPRSAAACGMSVALSVKQAQLSALIVQVQQVRVRPVLPPLDAALARGVVAVDPALSGLPVGWLPGPAPVPVPGPGEDGVADGALPRG